MSFFEDAIWTIGRGLAQTASKEMSDATGYDVGDTLNFLFGNGQETGGQDLSNLMDTIQANFKGSAEQLEFLQSTLGQQGEMLMDIGNELSSISQTMASLGLEINKIENLLIQIKNEQLFMEWQNIDLQITVYSNSITSGYKMYSGYIQHYEKTPTTLVELLRTNILDINTGPIVGMNGISKLILDNGMARGALQLWSNMVCALVNAGVMDYRDAVNQYIYYYQRLAFTQLTATNLVMEAYNLSNTPDAGKDFYQTYKSTILSQETTFIRWLMPIINAGILSSVYSKNKAYFVYPGIDASRQLNPNFATLENFTEYYEPSEILNRAEATLSALYNTDVDDRRIVVYMTYMGYSAMQNLLNTVDLTLTSTDKQTKVVSDKNDVLGPFAFPDDALKVYPDVNWTGDTNGYYIKRFVFTANALSDKLADNSYNLTNLNGSGNLVPQQTYASVSRPNKYGGKIPFLANSILDFELTVDETTNFDFMNFLAYGTPNAAPIPATKLS